MADEYADWRGHVIVCGLHGVGLRIVEQLSLSGVPAVIIDDDPDVRLARILAGWSVPHIAASSRTAETLARAGLAGATAVVCAYEDDLHTLGTALLTRQLRADVRVIVQLGNPAVGRALARAGVFVLDVAALAAPSIVELCLRTGTREIALPEERLIGARTTAPRSATLRDLYGALAPVGVVSAADGGVAVCPGRDALVAAGDEVTLVGTPDGLRAAGLGRYDRPLSAVPSAAARGAKYVRNLAVSLLDAADRRLVLALAALLAVLTVSTVVLRLAYHLAGTAHMSVLDAAYFTVETVTTVGYGDFSFNGQAPWLVASGIALMVAGATFVAVFFALLTNLIVSRRIEESLGRQRIIGLSGHVLVVGLGSVGMRVVEQLAAAGSEVVVVEKNENNRRLAQVRALGVPVVIADATLPEVLRSVRLASASAVAVLTSDDMANLETALAVRDQLGPRWDTTPVVLRVFDAELARSVKDTFEFHSVRSTSRLAALWFVGAALGLDVLSTFYVGNELLLVARLTVTPAGGLHGLQMNDLGARTRVLAIRRAANRAVLEHLPRRATRFHADDEAYLIGPYEELLTVVSKDRPARNAQDLADPAGPPARDHGAGVSPPAS